MADSQKTKEIKFIYFICAGNTCRSVAAEAYANYLVEKNNIPGFGFGSYGAIKSWCNERDTASPNGVKAGAKLGLPNSYFTPIKAGEYLDLNR
eukprot:UN14856